MLHPNPALPPRRGPRPLALHLALAGMRGSPPDPTALQALLAKLAANPPGLANLASLAGLQGKPGLGPDAALIHGIAAYRRHPAHRDVTDPPPIWQEGETALRDYGGDGPTLLLVPSLVNRATILDLAKGASLARALVAAGLRVMLLDWGWPDRAARLFDLEALITGRLSRAIDAAAAAAPRPGQLILAGYCMGGLLALAASLLRPEKIAGLALLATPWDFHAGRDTQHPTAIQHLLEALEPVLQLAGTLPVDVLQTLFNLADPHAVGDKYREFGSLDPGSARARHFVLIEDWLNDGVPLAAPLARECLRDWYGSNLPARGLWQVAGTQIDPARLRLPCVAAIAMRDRIVPPASALKLAEALPACTLIPAEAGHVGMIAGSQAETWLWQPLARWALGLPGFRNRRQGSKLSRQAGRTRKEKPA